MIKKKFFIILYFFAICVLLYNESLVADLGISLYSWGLITLASYDEANNDVFHLPVKYRSKHNQDTVVLYWKPPFEYIPSSNAICDNCVMTLDHSARDVADAIVFHFRETPDSLRGLPLQNRNPQQIWIWYSMEAPDNVLINFKKTLTSLNGIFNWTMTYRGDSDVFAPYGSFVTQSRIDYSESDILSKKTANSLGIAIISNCASKIRMKVIEELSKYISIDKYGSCYGKKLCRGDCQRKTISTYKFYFSFENTRCKHYITEKFWFSGLSSDAVPVVMGASREYYNLVAPENSYIHVDDFPSIKELAQYIKMLDKNDEMYMSYFKWRKNKPSLQWPPKNAIMHNDELTKLKGLSESMKYNGLHGCLLCKKLQERNRNEHQTIDHLDTWWFGDGYSLENKKITVCKEEEDGNKYYFSYQIMLVSIVIASIFCVCIKKKTFLR